MSATSQKSRRKPVRKTAPAQGSETEPVAAPVPEKKLVTYHMMRPGSTEGASGKVYKHIPGTKQHQGKVVSIFTCTVPEGEFDHLFNGDGSSKHVVGKL